MAAKKKSAKSARAKKKAPARAKAKAAPKKKAATSNGKSLALLEASPSFTVNDLEKSVNWYRDVVGFEVEETWKDGAGKVMGVSLKAGDVSFMIGQDDWKKGRDRQKGEGFRMFCMTKSNVDDLAKKIEAKGGRLDHPPTDQPWGVRDISLTDPDGFKITIAVAR
jgi:uncharacterized glyoxalase superfamily protein PhnB